MDDIRSKPYTEHGRNEHERIFKREYVAIEKPIQTLSSDGKYLVVPTTIPDAIYMKLEKQQ